MGLQLFPVRTKSLYVGVFIKKSEQKLEPTLLNTAMTSPSICTVISALYFKPVIPNLGLGPPPDDLQMISERENTLNRYTNVSSFFFFFM